MKSPASPFDVRIAVLICALMSLTAFVSPATAQQTPSAYAQQISPLSYPVSAFPLPVSADSASGLKTIERPDFSMAPGFYEDAITLEIQTIHEGSELRYTTDGSLPTRQSPLYEGPLLLESRAGEPNDISLIPTNDFGENHQYQEQWQEPLGEVFKIHTIRARVFPDDESLDPGPVLSGSFIIDEAGAERFSMPVISLSADREALFNDTTGIYVPGSQTEYDNYDQRGRDWEREAFMEVFEEDGSPALQLPVGLRIHGGTSRGRPRKSLRVYSRSDYGQTWMNYAFFPDKNLGQFKRLILRNSGNDWDGALFRDGFMQSLLRGLDLDMQHFRPAIVFINGEYWGIHGIRDRLDERYIETHYGLEEEEITMMELNGELDRGNPAGVQHYQQLQAFLSNPGVSSADNFTELQTRMDTENFADYNIAQIYFANTDWPGNNIKYWRANRAFDPDAPEGLDGRWRWMVFDTDFGFNLDFGYVTGVEEGPAHNTLRFALQDNGSNWPNPAWSTYMLRKLLENDAFKAGFVNRFADLLNTTFHPEYVVAELDSLAGLFEPEMAEHSARWVRPSMERWQEQLSLMESFAEQRAEYVRAHLLDEFDIGSGTETITLNIENENHGYIQLNRTPLQSGTPGVGFDGSVYPWSGAYFEGLEIRLKAVPRSGYAFAGWEGSYSSEEAEISILPELASNLTATFVPDDGSPAPDITPWVLSESGAYQFTEWAADAPAGSYPEAMKFYQTDGDEADPDISAPRAGAWTLPYDLENRSRINGLGGDGMAFINTENAQEEGGGYLGAAVLALNTSGISELYLGWRGTTIEPNSREYALRLQYRVGTEGEYEDITLSDGAPVEYVRDESAGASRYFGPITLPEALLNRPYVELRWNYHFTGTRHNSENGQRSKLGLSDIIVMDELPEGTPTLQFTDLLTTAQVDNNLPAFAVQASDASGSPDISFEGNISLQVEEGPGVLLGIAEAEAEGGLATFDAVSFSEAGRYILQAEYAGDDASSAKMPPLPVLSAEIEVLDLHEVVMPQIMPGMQPEHTARIPFAYRLRVEGLRPNATYRYANRIIDESDDYAQDGAGNMIFGDIEGEAFIRSTDSPDFDNASAGEGHFSFETNAEGQYEGWFITEPSGNRRFEPGNRVRIRLLLNDGQGGRERAHQLDSFSEIRVAEFGTTPGKGTAVIGISEAVSKNFIVLYDGIEGEGRPLYASFAEPGGFETDERYAAFYNDFVAGQPGRWAAMLPNDLPGGVRRIEERSLLDGYEVNVATSEQGIWGDGVSTQNPEGGLEMPLMIDVTTALPINDGSGAETPLSFDLAQNYPNPFNPSTQISYSIPESMHVRLDVYSVNGQIVRTLHNGVQAAGRHSITFDTSNMQIASGVYLYRLEAGDFISVKKMLLVK